MNAGDRAAVYNSRARSQERLASADTKARFEPRYVCKAVAWSCCLLFFTGSARSWRSSETHLQVAAAAPQQDEPLDAQVEAARRALRSGLAFLAKRQADEADGSLPAAGSAGAAPIGVTSLGAIAWMAGGSTFERGPHGGSLSRAIEYLLSRVDTSPTSPRIGYVSENGDKLSQMHGHGYATLAFAQVYTVSPGTPAGRRIQEALKLTISRIESSQHPDGGWGYEPVPSVQHEGSITITAVQALRAAHNVGFEVDTNVIAKAIDYVARSQNEDGSFRYSLRKEDKSSIALTAASIATLNATGDYSSQVISKGYDFIFRGLLERDGLSKTGTLVRWPHYERLYLAQALWQHADSSVFEHWVRKERTRVLTSQKADGSWSDSEYGDCYATAMNCLFLALPESLLPIFQR